MVTISKQSCRVCLSDEHKCTDLFESTEHEGNLIKEFYFNIVAQNTDKTKVDLQINKNNTQSYPQFICQNCKSSIIYLKNFIENCVQNEKLLQWIVNENKKHENEDITHVEILKESDNITELVRLQTANLSERFADNLSDETILQIDSIVLNSNTGVFLCKICNNQFVTKYDLKRHCYRHIGIEIDRPKCDTCVKSFKHHNELKNHINSCHPENQTFVCQQCNKDFYNQLTYRIHTLTYHKPKNKITNTKKLCNICGIKVPRLDIHVDIHRSEQDYFRCAVCPEKSYKRKAQLRVHIKTTHMKLKLRKCNYCEMRFSNSVSKTTHEVLEHDLEYPYKCNQCSYKCCTRYLYLRHIKMHLER